MAQLVITVKVRGKNPFGRKMTQRTKELTDNIRQVAAQASARSNRTTRRSFRRMRAANAEPRRGRMRNGMASGLRWIAKNTDVQFDVSTADQKWPYWIIQEIGTGSSATILRGGKANPQGRSAKGATYVKTVPSQKGRPISVALAWGTGPRGAYTPPGAAAGQQLHVASKLSGVPHRQKGQPFKRSRIMIGKEIRAQGMVSKGGAAGFFDVYLPKAIEWGKDAFKGYPYVP